MSFLDSDSSDGEGGGSKAKDDLKLGSRGKGDRLRVNEKFAKRYVAAVFFLPVHGVLFMLYCLCITGQVLHRSSGNLVLQTVHPAAQRQLTVLCILSSTGEP